MRCFRRPVTIEALMLINLSSRDSESSDDEMLNRLTKSCGAHLVGCITLCIALWAIGVSPATADWPTWRGTPNRGAETAEELPSELHLQWTMTLPKPQPAWPAEQGKIQFDASYEPVASQGRLFVPSMAHDHVTAYDLETGDRLWRFYTEGPVRFAPVVVDDRVLFGSDDGFLYCLAAADGSLRWKFRGGPDGRRILGNERLISMWPVRGAPVVVDGTLYFAAGVWPFMGIFVHALDAETGQVQWTNSGTGSNYLVQQHGSPAFAGVAPQGYLTVSKDVLLISGGLTVPAALDRKTGEFLYFRPGERSLGKDAGGYRVVTGDDWFSNRGGFYLTKDGSVGGKFAPSVVGKDLAIAITKGKMVGHQPQPVLQVRTEEDRKGETKTIKELVFPTRWTSDLPKRFETLHLRAGSQVYGAGKDGQLTAIRLPVKGKPAQVTWQGSVPGDVWSMLASDDRLIVVTRQGELFCFGADNVAQPRTRNERDVAATPPSPPIANATLMIGAPKFKSGYCVVIGLGDLQVIGNLVIGSNLHVIAIDPDAARCATARRRFEAMGVLGQRVAIIQSDLISAGLPPYLATLLLCLDRKATGTTDITKLVAACFHVLRPYGGVAVVPASEVDHGTLERSQAKFAGMELARQKRTGTSIITRAGSLPGAAPWTHQGGNISNTQMSADTRVKGPMGLLWFGGPSNKDVLPRHGHGPTPQVSGGRLVIEGPHMLRAVDVYTGRKLWQRELPDVGLYYNNTGHHPGASAIGSNFVTLPDGIYVAWDRQCLRLDPASGETVSTFTLPADESGDKPVWGFIGVHGELLIAGSSPVAPFTKSRAKEDENAVFTRFGEGSRRLVVMDRHTGKVLWKRDAVFNFRHNAIVAGGGKIYCLDHMTDARIEYLKRRGKPLAGAARLLVLDAATGKLIWETDDNVFGTWLSYSAPHNLLLQAGSAYRDRAKDEVNRGMTVYEADSGAVRWHSNDIYGGPPLLHDDMIITQDSFVSLLTGEAVLRDDPLTGKPVRWLYSRNYGCNTAIGCPNMLTFRSAAAGFFDLAGNGGTGNWGGFRSSCSSNLVPADGVLNAPDYTRTCVCSYQNQCSLALVHMPDMETWTFHSAKWTGKRVKRVGINFGAPGDKRDEDGVLWLDYPSVGGRSPDLPLEIKGTPLRYHRQHALTIRAAGHAWVQASGVEGVTSLKLTLSQDANATSRRHTVRLYFCEPKELVRGRRVFDVAMQGQTVLTGFDIAASAKQGHWGVVREFNDVAIKDQLEITFHSLTGTPVISGIEILVTE
jgi:outer membrane protein assembly factor BamB